MDYQWDPEKAVSNQRKHNIDFADAVGAFEDAWALTFEDISSHGEQRFITIGTDFLGRTLIVIYAYRKNAIRLISARAATRAERKEYEQRRI
jgi:uncharacterized protein